jgi:nicotinamide mononucleotide transporter
MTNTSPAPDATLLRPLPGATDRTNDIVVSLLIGLILTSFSYAVGAAAGWITTGINPLEAFAVFTSYVSTYLCVKQRRFNYWAGAVSTAAYCMLFAQYGLLASSVLNGYLMFSLVYGWFRWRSDENTRPVTRLPFKWVPIYTIVTVAAWGGAMGIVLLLGGTIVPADALILAGSILAQFLLDNKRIATWYVWAVVNVLAIWVYFTVGLPLAGVQYIFFLANVAWGYIEWRKSMALDAAVAVAEPETRIWDNEKEEWKTW